MSAVLNPTIVFMAILVAIGWAGAVFAASKAFRARSVEGVSLTTVALTIAMHSLWATYGLFTHSPIQLVLNVPCALAYGIIFAIAIRKRAHRARKLLFFAFLMVAAVSIAALISSPVVLAATLTGLTFSQRVPQMIDLVRGIFGAGLSWQSSLAGTIAGFGWVGLGAMQHDSTVIICSGWSGVCAAFITVGILRAARKAISNAEPTRDVQLAQAA